MKGESALLGLGILCVGLTWAGQLDGERFSGREERLGGAAQEALEIDNEEIELLTDVQAGLECAAVFGGDYRFKTRRQVQFDILRLDDLFVHLSVQENSLFGWSPSQFDHSIEYVSIGHETRYGRIRFFWDHTCHNPSRALPHDQRNTIRWNELGIGYETRGMRLGHKDDGIPFDESAAWLKKIDWGASLSRVWMRHENSYDYMLKLAARHDMLRVRNHVFYVQGDLTAVYDRRGGVYNPAVEIGDRVRLARTASLSPFLAYQRFRDWYALGRGEDLLLAGVRLEMGLGRGTFGSTDRAGYSAMETAPRSPRVDVDEFPRVTIRGGYNVNVHGGKKDCRSSDLNVDVDLLRLDHNKTLAVNTYAGLVTFPGAFGIQSLNYKVGPSVGVELDTLDLRVFHSYASLHGAEHSGRIKDYHQVGLGVSGADRLRWSAQGAVYASTHNYDYWGDVEAGVGYDFHTRGWITPYVRGAVRALLATDEQVGQSLETGLKMGGNEGNFSIYLRWQDDYDTFRFGEGRQMWLGFLFTL